MLFKAVILLLAVAAASAQVRVPLRQCPGGWNLPEWFESNDCTPERCTLRRGQIFAGRAHVITQEAFTQLWVAVEATAFGIPIDMPIPEGYENACDFLEGGASCPVTSGGAYTWAVQFPVLTFLPALPNVQIRLFAGEDNRRVACGEVDATIV